MGVTVRMRLLIPVCILLGLSCSASKSSCQDQQNLVEIVKREVKAELEEMFVNTIEELQHQLEVSKKEMEKLKVAQDKLEEENYFSFYCAVAGVQYNMARSNRSITYEAVMLSSPNVEGSSFDKFSGVYTSGLPGVYSVTWSLVSSNGPEDSTTRVRLRQNGVQVYHSTTISGSGGGVGEQMDQGGRTLYLQMERGDTLDLFCDDCSAGIGNVSFCVSLAKASQQ